MLMVVEILDQFEDYSSGTHGKFPRLNGLNEFSTLRSESGVLR